ncbi:hypothetical protein E1263_41815 [Kribbella antibiotica]|uniref:Uncharacterized protein n=1 Tax=Kribbella antibiotica TaxID=190195 RepID=A0A4R4YEF8_9ACTN|nr:hypothetical protein [Kribbella antibiotica]TDD43128.1 hypothetical protein E1263_41815 [Kribbella antibiotica]
MSAPEIAGYQFEQLLLEHPLAEVWRGRAFTGMEVVALVLTDAGAREQVVQERLVQAGRDAALEPGQAETPLWAANFNAERPYAITQLVPGQSGAERLIDSLDGVLGNDDESLREVRSLLSQYGGIAPTASSTFPSYVGGAAPPTEADAQPEVEQSVVEPDSRLARLGGWVYAVAAVVVLLAFTVTYSVGAAVGGVVKDGPTAAPPPAAVSPAALPETVLLPGLPKITTAPYKRPDGKPGLLGATYEANADLQVVTKADLPFALGWPRPPAVSSLGESSTIAYRRIQTDEQSTGRKVPPDLRLALSACANLKDCTTKRQEFDQQWTKVYKATAPTVAKDERTWLTAQEKTTKTEPYALMMTRAFQSGGQWWLVGVAVTGAAGEELDVQRVLNDIWRQTS